MHHFRKYPSINYYNHHNDIEHRFVNTPYHIQEKIDGSNIGISFIKNKVSIQSRTMPIAHVKFSNYIKNCDWYPDIEKYLMHRRDIVIYGEVCVPGKSPSRITTYKDYDFKAFDILYRIPDQFMKPKFAEKTFEDINIPYVPINRSGIVKSIHELKTLITDLKSEAEQKKIEGYVLKTDRLTRCKIKPDTPQKIPSNRSQYTESSLPYLPDEEVYATITRIRDEHPSEFSDIKTAMPLIGRAVSEEAKKHRSRPPKNLVAYYDTIRSEQL